MDSKKKSNIIAYLQLVLVFTLWGSLYVVSKSVLNALPPFTISFFRFLIAYITLSFFDRKKTNFAKKEKYYIYAIGFFGYFMSVGLQLIGTKYLGSSMASLINSLNPITMTLFGYIILRESLTINKILGVIVAVLGVVFIVGVSENINKIGLVISFCAVIIWSIVSVLTRKIGKNYSSLSITRSSIKIACILYFFLFLFELPTINFQMFSPQVVISLFYMGAICTGLTYYLWNRSLSVLSASSCSMFYPLQPITASIFSFIFTGERLNTGFLIGTAIVVFGVVLNLSGSNRESSNI